ncbi:MAG TPA: matrixin family metalloprotease [Thermoanaerobaculia bacterium]|nr:matrixin family metalloprotease [Thermoanaerobaculia bacterium]
MLARPIALLTLLLAAPLAATPRPTPAEFEEAFLQSLATSTRPAVCFAPGTSSDYIEHLTRLYGSGSDPLFQTGDGGHSKFRFANRWSATATDGGGLLQGDPTTLTWSYIPDGTAIPGQIGEPSSASSLFAWLNGIYGNQNAWHQVFVQVFTRWSQLTGIRYVYQPTDDGAAMFSSPGVLGVRGDVRIGAHFIDGNSNVLAYNFFPNGGDMVLDANDSFFSNTGTSSLRLRNVAAHEHGHGLGFNHVCPVNATKLMEPFVTLTFDGPQHDDILAGQRGYGDTLDFDLNDTAGSATVLGDPTVGSITVNDVSIDDNADVDYYRFTVTGATSVSATVTPIGFTYLEGPQNNDGSCTAGTNFNSLVLNDLGVSLVDTNGTTVLTTANVNPAGTAETATFALPGAGNYYVRVFGGSSDNVQLYRLDLAASNFIFGDGFETGNTGAWGLVFP